MCNMEFNLQVLLEVASLKIRRPNPGLTMSGHLLAGLRVEGNGWVPGASGISRSLQASHSTLFGSRERRKPSPPQRKAVSLPPQDIPFLRMAPRPRGCGLSGRTQAQ